MSKSNFKDILEKFTKNAELRKELFNSIKSDEISEIIITNVNHPTSLGFNVYCSALSLINDEEKLFEIVENILPRLNRDELSVRSLQDFYSRISLELNKKSLNFVVKTAYLCYNSLETGDKRAIFYKDLLPICLKLLARNDSKVVSFKSNDKTCREYRQDIISQVLRKPFCTSIITNLVSMFNDIELSPAQQNILIAKTSENMSKVSPNEIANLALVTFNNISSYSQIIVPLLALDKYFSKRRYRFELSELDTPSVDSIEETPMQGICQAEETVIYHFQNFAEFTTLEKDMTSALKSLEHAPNIILSPFLCIILVSIAKISSSVQGNFRLNQSTILPFMKSVFKFNEEHRGMLRTSGWAKTIDPIEAVNTEPLLKILKENTCKLKQDLALNGLFGLSFLLLKTKSSNELNKFAIEFLNEIIRNRPEFTGDIMFIIVKMLFCEKNKAPIIECFSSFMNNRHLDITASEPALKKLIEDLTELDLDTALSIESVIFTAITKSITLRDVMIEIMKKAMYQRNSTEVRKMAVLSFCIMLRKFTMSRASGNQPRFSHNISMFSLTQSQIAINLTANRNVRQAEIIMLEILGLLRRCFSENNDIKILLYESLFNSISTNDDIIPYIVEFLDGHFRMYFECDSEEDADLIINFEKLFKSNKSTDELIVMDDLGHLLKFIINCLTLTPERHDKLNCDIDVYEKILKKLVEKCPNCTMDHLHVFSTLNSKNCVIISQFLNCLEALMVYCYHKIRDDDENVSKIIILFLKHQKTMQKVKKLLENFKKGQKSDKNSTVSMIKKNEKVEIKLNCIWSLKDCSAFLKAVFGKSSIEKMNEMKQDKDFCKFVLDSTAKKLKSFEISSDYTKMKYSHSMFESFLHISIIIYQQLKLDVFKVLYESYSIECALSLTEAFMLIISGMEITYCDKKDKWMRFLKLLTKSSCEDYDKMLMEIIETIHKLIDWGFEVNKQQDFVSSTNGCGILNNLFLILEMLYLKVENETGNRSCFNWMLTFCKKISIKTKSLSTTVIRLLMCCINLYENVILIDCIAHKIATCYKYRRVIVEPEHFAQNNLSIIGKQTTVDEAFHEFMEFIKGQIQYVEIYLKRANSFNAHIRMDGQDSRNETCDHMQQIETALCTKLVSIGKSIERLASCNFPVTIKIIEKFVGIINVYYKSLENLMKHFRKHYDVRNINYQCIGIEELLKYSKKFATSVYSIVPYIEATVDADFNASNEKKEVKTKKRDMILNKSTKIVPRMIFLIESFNKSVNLFDSAAKTHFNKLLHAGEIRDFHIRNSILFDALKSSQTTARNQALTDMGDDESTENTRQVSIRDQENSASIKSKKRKHLILDSSDSSTDDESNSCKSVGSESLHDINDSLLTKERFEENVKLLSKRGSRGRTTRAPRGRKKQ